MMVHRNAAMTAARTGQSQNGPVTTSQAPGHPLAVAAAHRLLGDDYNPGRLLWDSPRVVIVQNHPGQVLAWQAAAAEREAEAARAARRAARAAKSTDAAPKSTRRTRRPRATQ